MEKKIENVAHFDKLHAREKQTDGRTLHDGSVMHSVAGQKAFASAKEYHSINTQVTVQHALHNCAQNNGILCYNTGKCQISVTA